MARDAAASLSFVTRAIRSTHSPELGGSAYLGRLSARRAVRKVRRSGPTTISCAGGSPGSTAAAWVNADCPGVATDSSAVLAAAAGDALPEVVAAGAAEVVGCGVAVGTARGVGVDAGVGTAGSVVASAGTGVSVGVAAAAAVAVASTAETCAAGPPTPMDIADS